MHHTFYHTCVLKIFYFNTHKKTHYAWKWRLIGVKWSIWKETSGEIKLMRKATFTARARWHKRSGRKKDIATYLCVSWLRKSYKLRIHEKSDGVQNNPSRSINTIRHSVVCGTSRCPDAYLVYSFSQFNYYFGFHWLINQWFVLKTLS